MNRAAILGTAASALFLCVAASDVSKFYQTMPHRTADRPATSDAEYVPSSGDAKDDVAAQGAAGFELIGYSSFNGKEAGKGSLLKFGRKVGAERIIYGAKYTNTEHTGTFASASGTPGNLFAFAIPMQLRRYDQMALFFRKAPRMGLGVYADLLKAEEHTKIGTNKGVRITSVTRGSPAFEADILPGDIMISMNGAPVYDAESMGLAIRGSYGKKVAVSLLREGVPVEKTIALSADGHY